MFPTKGGQNFLFCKAAARKKQKNAYDILCQARGCRGKAGVPKLKTFKRYEVQAPLLFESFLNVLLLALHERDTVTN